MQLAGKFTPVAKIRSASQVSDINTNNHKPEQEMFIGISRKTLINKLFQEGKISPAEKQKFYSTAHTFYSETFPYAIQKLPISDSVLKHSVSVDISKRDVASFDDVLYFVEKFKLDYDPAKVNPLSEHFLDYQMLSDYDIPNPIWQNACNNYGKKTKYYRTDIL